MSQPCPLCGKAKPDETLFCGECERRIRSDYEVKVPENEAPGPTRQGRPEREEVPQRQEISENEIVGPGQSDDKHHEIPGPVEDPERDEGPEREEDLEPNGIKPKKSKRFVAPLLFLLVVLLLGGAFLIYNETVRKENLERSGWETALKLNSVGGYLAYMEAFPHGIHSKEAQEGLLLLKSEEASAWEQMKASGNTSELRGFITRHPESPYAPLIERRLDSLSWIGALQVNTPESYSEYLMQSERGELRGEYELVARERYSMLHQSSPVVDTEIENIRNTISGFYAALSGTNHDGAFQYLAPTVSRFFSSGAASRERIAGELLMARTRAQGATLSFTPGIEAVRYERNARERYVVNVPLTKSYVRDGVTERVPGYVVHMEMNPDFQISSIYETKPHPDAP